MSLVVVSEYLQDQFLDRLRSHFDVLYDPDMFADRPRLLDEVGQARAIVVRNRTRIDEELLGRAAFLEVVGRLGVGLDNIDMEAAAAAGVTVYPAYGANAVSVAEYVMGAMLFLRRGVFTMTASMTEGLWPRQGHAFGRELDGETLGLIGFGSIAREVVRRASSFGMSATAHDPYVPADDPTWGAGVVKAGLEEVLAGSDVVSVHVPLMESTRHLIDEAAISLMREDSILINTSRGGVVDEDALAEALREGRIGGAALDVFESEPLGEDAASRFRGLDNVLLTPHIAGNTIESVDRVASITVDSVLGALAET